MGHSIDKINPLTDVSKDVPALPPRVFQFDIIGDSVTRTQRSPKAGKL